MYEHIDLISVHIWVKAKPTVIDTSHVTAIHASSTNMPCTFHTDVMSFRDMYEEGMHIRVSHGVTSINHVTRSSVYILQKLHFMSLAFNTEQI